MPAEDIKPALRLYVQRLMYQRALAAGGSRYDLNGEPCGEVTAEHAASAATAAAHIAAVAQTKAAAAVASRKANNPRKVSREFQTAMKPTSPTNIKNLKISQQLPHQRQNWQQQQHLRLNRQPSDLVSLISRGPHKNGVEEIAPTHRTLSCVMQADDIIQHRP
jgi:sRNA-binding protein